MSHKGSRSVSAAETFQNAIRDGKAERKLRAELKRLKDLQRIEKMNSIAGNDPKVASAEVHPENDGNSKMASRTRVRDILFPQVVKVDEFHGCLADNHGSYYYCFVPLRRLSKSMRTAVDCLLEENLMERVRGMKIIDPIVYLNPNKQYPSRTLMRMLTSFGGRNAGKRFFMRALSLEFSRLMNTSGRQQTVLELFHQFNNNVTALLKLIGNQIWHFRISISLMNGLEKQLDGFMLSEFYTLIFRWIYLMPNLKWLSFGTMLDTRNTSLSHAFSVFRKYPFPHLPKLEKVTFNITPWRVETSPIFKGILAANQHINILDLEGGDDSFKSQVLPAHLIKSFQLTHFYATNESSEELSLRWIQPIVNVNWKLKTILLFLNFVDVSMFSLFRFLEHFPTLESVNLLCVNASIEDTDTYGNLELPNLTHLDIDLNDPEIDYGGSNLHFFFSLQFLKHCKKLTKLGWGMRFMDPDEPRRLRSHLVRFEHHKEMVNFRAGLRVLYYSNIWDYFRLLENVQIIISEWSDCDYDCEHGYHRAATGEGMVVSKLLERHRCNFKYCPISLG